MTRQYAQINKEILTLLRVNTKVSFEYLERSIKKPRATILEWESLENSKLPTIKQAKALARSYRVPFACLYMKKEDIKTKSLPSLRNMRNLENSASTDDSQLNLAIIETMNARDFLIQARRDLGESIPVFLLTISGNSINKWASTIREYFGIDLSVQLKCSSARQLYLYIKNSLEEKGIFIQGLRDVPLESARGIAIYNEDYPIIGINDDDRYPAKTFSIIHELVHIIKRSSSLCTEMFTSLTTKYKEEVFCNAVAGEVLVPETALKVEMNRYANSEISTTIIGNISKRFSVSKEVIVRRLLDVSPSYIDIDEYHKLSEELIREYESEKAAEKQLRTEGLHYGIFSSPHRDAVDRTSLSIGRCFLQGLGDGLFDKQDISRFLELAPRHVDKYLTEVSVWSK